MTFILRAVAVGVADQRTLPVVVEGVGYGDVVEEPVVVVFVVVAVWGQVAVVDPHVLCVLHCDGVAADDFFFYNNVADYDVVNVFGG